MRWKTYSYTLRRVFANWRLWQISLYSLSKSWHIYQNLVRPILRIRPLTIGFGRMGQTILKIIFLELIRKAPCDMEKHMSNYFFISWITFELMCFAKQEWILPTPYKLEPLGGGEGGKCTKKYMPLHHAPHRISAGGSLLFMRCGSLTLTGLISTWPRGVASPANLAKPSLDCVTLLCLVPWKSRHLQVCRILKGTYYFQTYWISCILNWDVKRSRRSPTKIVPWLK